MNCHGAWARLTRAVPQVMRAIEASITRRGPKRSTRRPKAGCPAALTRRLAVAARASVERSPAELGEDRLEEDPEREVDTRSDEQDDEAGGQRPPAPRAARNSSKGWPRGHEQGQASGRPASVGAFGTLPSTSPGWAR